MNSSLLQKLTYLYTYIFILLKKQQLDIEFRTLITKLVDMI